MRLGYYGMVWFFRSEISVSRKDEIKNYYGRAGVFGTINADRRNGDTDFRQDPNGQNHHP